uniref:Complement component C1q receptor n=2 Tax=Gouania willdenowi TaxID=441366 RepID=A0A8C5DQK3_GOUWI
MLLLILLLCVSFKELSGAEHKTLCGANTCFTLHLERVSFQKAKQNCNNNGGYLMTQRDPHEEDVLYSLLSLTQKPRQERSVKVWIGLKLHRQDCVFTDQTLKGFKWVSGEEDSQYSNWKKEPVSTCTEERCVRVDLEMKWSAATCKSPSFYACKFYFKGMCSPLTVLGAGTITYTAPFSKEPEIDSMSLIPLGTYANILCSDQQSFFSVCTSVAGTYSWTDPGPFCSVGERSCGISNGGCAHVCHQAADGVTCECRNGYHLEPDGLACRIQDLCTPDTCEHQCMMGESGFYCTCAEGFMLSENKRNCSDLNECQSQPCMDHECVNIYGSYTCVCTEGYEMVNGKCMDVDECVESRCEHSCWNNIGSFTCVCNEGFTLSKDGSSCEDIDECVADGCVTHFTCVNTAGGFTCTHPQDVNVHVYGAPFSPDTTVMSSAASPDEGPQHLFTETSIRATDEPPFQTDVGNESMGEQHSNTSSATGPAHPGRSRVVVYVLGSLIPLLLLVAVTFFIAVFRSYRIKKEETKKKETTDGYCWVSSGLDPRLEKLYESIVTDDL